MLCPVLFSGRGLVALLLLNYILSVQCYIQNPNPHIAIGMCYKNGETMCPKHCKQYDSNKGISLLYILMAAGVGGIAAGVAAPYIIYNFT